MRAAGTAIARVVCHLHSATFFFGVQMALAFYFVNLQDFHATMPMKHRLGLTLLFLLCCW
jgi:hypothetical protein